MKSPRFVAFSAAGPIPEALGALSNLIELYLADNRLTGEIRSESANTSAISSMSPADA